MATNRNANITKSVVEALEPGSLVWDRRVSGFGARRQKAAVMFLLKTVVHGQQRWFSIGRYGSPWTVEQARDQANIMLGRIKNGEDPVAERDKAQIPVLTVAQAAERFLAEHGTKLKPRTHEEYARLVRLYINPTFGKRPLVSITQSDVITAHANWEEHQRAANHAMAVLSKLMSWAEEHNFRPRDTNPCRHIKKYKETRRQRYLTATEIGRLGAAIIRAERDPDSAINPYAAAAIRLLLLTGARKNEILTLKWSMVDLFRKVLLLDDSKTDEKTIVLSEAAAALLTSIPRVQGNPYVIVGDKPGKHLVGLFKTWKRVRELAELDEVRIHDLRHTFASMAVHRGGSLPIIGRMLGHNQAQTTERYAHLSQDPVRDLVQTTSLAIAEAMNTPPAIK